MKVLTIGDAVSWCQIQSQGNGILLTTKEGKVVAIDKTTKPETATVQMKNGRKNHLPISDLRMKGVKTQLTELFEKMEGMEQ